MTKNLTSTTYISKRNILSTDLTELSETLVSEFLMALQYYKDKRLSKETSSDRISISMFDNEEQGRLEFAFSVEVAK